MRKVVWALLIVLVVVAVVLAALVLFWPWIGPLLPHPLLLKAWLEFIFVDLNLAQRGPVALLLLVGLIELIWALTLGNRSGAFERYAQRLERQHARQVDLLNQQIALLKDERRMLRAEVDMRQDLIREERIRLWTQFDDMKRASGLAWDRLVDLDASPPPPEVASRWRQIIAQLERIEMVRASMQVKDDSTQMQRVDDLLQLGIGCYQLGQYERAATHFGHVIDLMPGDADVLINRGVVYHSLGRNQAALQDLDRALKLSENPWAYLVRGLAREGQGEERRALEDYTRAIRLNPDLLQAYHRRGLLLACLGEYGKALQDQSHALEIDEGNASAYLARGLVQAALGQFEPALGDLDMACALDPLQVRSYLERGKVRHQLACYDQALEDFDRVIDLMPLAEAYMARGATLSALGEYAKAIANYSQAIDQEPKNAMAFYARGKAQAAMLEDRLAIEDFDRALALVPDLAQALAERGALHEKLGDSDQALVDLNRAIALNPNLAAAYANRGLVYGHRGEYEKASRDLNRATELDPSLEPGQQEALDEQPELARSGS